ncbi:MAG: CAP domain-containing protein [Verrucomicrobiota bacterium]|nr:CAP domain-containing protein [Verrucomicrobiota bacterium]
MRINCPVCSTSIEVSEAHIGKKGRCSSCSSKFIIPELPEAEYEILERGEIPAGNSVEKNSAILQLPAGKKPSRPAARFRVSRQEVTSANNPVTIISGILILAALIVLFSWEENQTAGKPSTRETSGNPGETLRPEAPQRPADTARANATAEQKWPLSPADESPPPPSTPEESAQTNNPVAEKKFELSAEKQSQALAYLKSSQPGKRKGAYTAMRKLGDEAKPIYLQLLKKAKDHYLGQAGDIAFNLSVDENALTDFKESYDNWQDSLISVKEIVQTDWKTKAPQEYKQRHQEMDNAFAEVARLYSRTVTRVDRARRLDLASLDSLIDILTEIAGETAWCHNKEAGKRPELISTVRNAGGADGFIKMMNNLDQADQLIRERAAVAKHNATSNWAGNAHMQFAALLNDRRAAIALTPLRLDEDLSRGCRDHSIDMASNGYFSHTGLTSETRTFTIRARRAGFNGSPSGECIFAGNPAAAAAHRAWWYSDGHRLIMYASGPGTLGLGTSGNHWTLNTAR